MAADRIAPELDADGPFTAWWYIRKAPCWRIRYQPGLHRQARVEQLLDELASASHITSWTKVTYEPEVHAFGGPEAMAAAHRLFHADSRGVLGYLRDQPGGRHRREISLMLCSIMMRTACQDHYEQGDVWARVADHRAPPVSTTAGGPDPDTVRRFLIVDATSWMRDSAPFAHCAEWASAYAAAGRELADLAAGGRLRRGLRSVLAQHVIFAWNRLGLPYATQSALASTAKTAVFGPDPAMAEP